MGKFIYAIGNNPVATKYAGIAVDRTITLVYVLAGALLALAGMILVARLDSAQPTVALGYEFDAIAAVVVGGTSFAGGEGGIGGTLFGVLLIVKGKMPPFVATLAMMTVARGATLVYTEGRSISGIDEQFIALSSAEFLGITMPVLMMLGVLLIAFLVLRFTPFGNYVYSTGGNEEISRLAGIKTQWVTLGVYVISGVTAALGGVLLVARLWSAQANAAVGAELDAIAAPVLGGVSLFGGVGSVVGTVVGAFILGILSNGLNLMGIPSFYQQVIKGVVLILAIVLDLLTKRRQ